MDDTVGINCGSGKWVRQVGGQRGKTGTTAVEYQYEMIYKASVIVIQKKLKSIQDWKARKNFRLKLCYVSSAFSPSMWKSIFMNLILFSLWGKSHTAKLY